MIFTLQRSDLQRAIDKMALPVFVIDLEADNSFRLVALNASHSKATGLTLENVAAKTPHMILPKSSEADFLTSRFRACLAGRKPISYSARLTYKDEAKETHTILHPICLGGRAPTRLVGVVKITAHSSKDMAACEASNPRPQPKADLQSIEEILDGVRLSQTISSKDLMVLGALSKKCNLSLSDIARMVDVSGHPTTPPASPSLVAL